MQLPPLKVLLSWPTPNYTDPKVTRGHELVTLSFVFFSIAIFAVALRTFTRIRISRSFGVDDIFLLAAVPPATAVAVLTSLAHTRWGWNRHIWDVPFDLVTLGLKLTIAMECLFAISVSCTKISLLILTRRILTSSTGILRHVAAAVMAAVALEAVIFSVVAINTCSPVSAYWTLSVKPQHCIDERLHLFIGGIINTITDFLVFFLPLPAIFNLQIPRRQQVILTLLMGAGFSVCIAGVFRIYYSWKSTSTYDRTWVSYGLWISSVLELNVGIICTSIPACKPFFTRYLPTVLGSVSLRGTKASYSHSQSQSHAHRDLSYPLSTGDRDRDFSSRKQITPSLFTQDDTDADLEAQVQVGEKGGKEGMGSKPLELKMIPVSKFSTRIVGGKRLSWTGRGRREGDGPGDGSGSSGGRGNGNGSEVTVDGNSKNDTARRKNSSESVSSRSTVGSAQGSVHIHRGESSVEVVGSVGSAGRAGEETRAGSTEVLVKREWIVSREG